MTEERSSPDDRVPGQTPLPPASMDLPLASGDPRQSPLSTGPNAEPNPDGQTLVRVSVQDAAASAERRARGWKLPVAIVALMALCAGSFVVARTVAGGGRATAVQLVAADETGSSPFTTDASTFDLAEAKSVLEGKADLGEIALARIDAPSTRDGRSPKVVSAATTTAYASASTAPCDVEKLITDLKGDDAARAAWARLMEVRDDQVEETLRSLTPLVLARDTAVTNTSYAKGAATRFQAILQAGTPVLVDRAGLPRVKCSCGNPLLPPEQGGDVALEGKRWENFDPAAVIEVDAAAKAGTVSVLDLASNKRNRLELPGSGQTVNLDGYLVDDASGVYVVADDGTKSQVLDHPVSAVFDDGAGGIVFQYERSGGEYLSYRRNTVNQPPPDDRTAAIWWLPAGAEVPQVLVDSDDFRTHWFSLQDAGPFSGRPQIAYLELRGPSNCDADAGCLGFDEAEVKLRDMASGETETVKGLGDANGRLRIADGAVAVAWVFDDHGGLAWADDRFEPQTSGCDIDCGVSFADVVDAATFVALSSSGGYTLEACDFATGHSCRSFELSSSEPAAEQDAVAFVDGRRAVVSVLNADGSAAASYSVNLDSGEIRVLDLPGRAVRLTHPLLRPRPTGGRNDAPTDPASLVLRGDGLGPLRIGADADEVLTALQRVFGEADRDSGWGSGCDLAGPDVPDDRYVAWSGLTIALQRPRGGKATFSGWMVEVGEDPSHPTTRLRTAQGLGVGSTVADAAAHPGLGLIEWNDIFLQYETSLEVDGGVLWITTTGPTASDTIGSMTADIGACE